jgi:hypothetical protein
MKGIVHFLSGVAVATFFPEAVRQATHGSLVLVLGGLFGLLPDTLDFRFLRFLETYDLEIDPDPQKMQPQVVAERVAAMLESAYETGKTRRIVLHTARLGPDQWRRYTVRFCSSPSEIRVRVGPIVSTAGLLLPGSVPETDVEGRAAIEAPLAPVYDQEIIIDAFSGPSFAFERAPACPQAGAGGGASTTDVVKITFLPWHRRWSHSLPLAVVSGLLIDLLLGPTAGLVSGLGFATHALQDQLGYMGSSLWWPLTRRRFNGLRWFHSGDSLPNSLTVWLAAALILFNLDRFAATPRLPAVPYLLAAVLLPLLLTSVLHRRERRRAPRLRHADSPEVARQREALAETEELEL